MPALINAPEYLHPYNYAFQNTLIADDQKGLGIVDIIKCLYYGKKVAGYGEQCNESCPKDFGGKGNFIEQYTDTGSLSAALVSCTCNKAGKDLCNKWLESYFKGSYKIKLKPKGK